MSNWCHGNFSISGKFDNIRRFFKEGLRVQDMDGKEVEEEIFKDIDKDNFAIMQSCRCGPHVFIYIKDTDRCFLGNVEGRPYEEYKPDKDGWIHFSRGKQEDDITICAVGSRAAWSWKCDSLKRITKRYGIWIVVTAEEEFETFHQYIVVSKNGIEIVDETISISSESDNTEEI